VRSATRLSSHPHHSLLIRPGMQRPVVHFRRRVRGQQTFAEVVRTLRRHQHPQPHGLALRLSLRLAARRALLCARQRRSSSPQRQSAQVGRQRSLRALQQVRQRRGGPLQRPVERPYVSGSQRSETGSAARQCACAPGVNNAADSVRAHASVYTPRPGSLAPGSGTTHVTPLPSSAPAKRTRDAERPRQSCSAGGACRCASLAARTFGKQALREAALPQARGEHVDCARGSA